MFIQQQHKTAAALILNLLTHLTTRHLLNYCAKPPKREWRVSVCVAPVQPRSVLIDREEILITLMPRSSIILVSMFFQTY